MDGRLQVLQLINEQNTLSRPLSLENVALALPVKKGADDPRNTGVQVAGIHGKGYKGQIEIFYDRHDLPELFAEAGITPALRSTTVEAITPAWIIAQLNAKHGLYLEAADLETIDIPVFTDLEETHDIEIAVKDDSWNWVGTITLQMTYGNPLLETVVLVQLLPVLVHPEDMKLLGNRRSGQMSTYNFDFTAYKDDLQIDPKRRRWLNFDRVMEIGAKAGLPAWSNNIVGDYPTSAIPGSNPKFQRVMVQNVSAGGVIGPIYFHYDLDW